jgi:hypothetical protein
MPEKKETIAEVLRLHEAAQRKGNWKRWGPYLSERQWATVREDYSPDGDVWNYFPHDAARSRAYRWGEDGILGICDRECRLCFALAMWNGRDPILKERMFGLTGPEGNHGEDVKECFYYLKSTPTHSYLKGLYKYPQGEYPYGQLIEQGWKRGRKEPEFELEDTGIFDQNKYFDVFAEYAKNSPNDILIKITVANRGPAAAPLHLIPTLWFRNTWTWGSPHETDPDKPYIQRASATSVELSHQSLGKWRMEIEPANGSAIPELLFTDNETNEQRMFGVPGPRYAKDAFHQYIINSHSEATNPKGVGTKLGVLHVLDVPAGGAITVRLRLFSEDEKPPGKPFGADFEKCFQQRIAESDEFYSHVLSPKLLPAEKAVAEQAYAGLLWSKQFYHYAVADWLDGDPNEPPPPESRKSGRNSDWRQVFCRDVISMPDKWEFPWFAAWDLAFHMLPLAHVDPEMAKAQLVLFLREWYMHPNGQLPAYELNFSDVNPPVHAWACWRVYKISNRRGERDTLFLERTFQKLLMNFTWWVNRKDITGKQIFAGGFLGLDNIGIFDRSKPLPTGGTLEQADGTAWMAFYCATMLAMAIELAQKNPAYEDVASKFFEHFIAITDAINTLGGSGLWDDADGFYYDQLQIDGKNTPLKLRTVVGIIPLFAAQVLESHAIQKLPGFLKRMQWFLDNRKDLAKHISYMEPAQGKQGGHYLLAIPSREKLTRVLKYALAESEFLSPFGIRSLSQVYRDHPYFFDADGQKLSVYYEPGESQTNIFGGNSNWRGPVWFPVNYLLIEALERYHHFYGDEFKVECPTGSGKFMTLQQVARELESRLTKIFLPDAAGNRPSNNGQARYASDPNWRNLVLFHEYFHGDNGKGLGASHQTGWTSLVVRCLQNLAKQR